MATLHTRWSTGLWSEKWLFHISLSSWHSFRVQPIHAQFVFTKILSLRLYNCCAVTKLYFKNNSFMKILQQVSYSWRLVWKIAGTCMWSIRPPACASQDSHVSSTTWLQSLSGITDLCLHHAWHNDHSLHPTATILDFCHLNTRPPSKFDNSSDKFLHRFLQTSSITASLWLLTKE